jgi:uncharacterized protein (TIGR04255 family)
VQFRFGAPVEFRLLQAVAAKLLGRYPAQDTLMNVTAKLDLGAGKKETTQGTPVGMKLTALDGAAIALLNVDYFSISRLAPYQGWDEFRARIDDGWGVWKSIIGYREISRAGMRYINRVDVPIEGRSVVRIEDYLRLYVEVPEQLPQVVNFSAQIVGRYGDGDRQQLVLTTATLPSPLIDHVSFAIDIDVSRDVDVPQNDRDLWALIDRIRTYKNDIFENAITDRARVLFQ